MTKWEQVVSFFAEFDTDDFVIRKMYMDAFGLRISANILENYRCILQRAGYIYDSRDFASGVYYISRKIPRDLSYTQAYREAYQK